MIPDLQYMDPSKSCMEPDALIWNRIINILNQFYNIWNQFINICNRSSNIKVDFHIIWYQFFNIWYQSSNILNQNVIILTGLFYRLYSILAPVLQSLFKEHRASLTAYWLHTIRKYLKLTSHSLKMGWAGKTYRYICRSCMS